MLPPTSSPSPPRGGSGPWGVSQISRNWRRDWGRGSGWSWAQGLGSGPHLLVSQSLAVLHRPVLGVLVVDFSHKLKHLHLAGLQVAARAPLELVVHGICVWDEPPPGSRSTGELGQPWPLWLLLHVAAARPQPRRLPVTGSGGRDWRSVSR